MGQIRHGCATMIAQRVIDALTVALWRRGKQDALLHHSDQGSQHTSEPSRRHRFKPNGERRDGELLLLAQD